MTTTPIEQLASLRVGTVEFISPDRIEVQLDIESPDSVALGKGACVCPLRARGTAPFWHDKIDPSGQDKNDPCR